MHIALPRVLEALDSALYLSAVLLQCLGWFYIVWTLLSATHGIRNK